MFSLRFLGGAGIEGPEGPVGGRATQRRRLALLALLSLAHGRALSRDKLIGYLWPEHNTEQARRLLTVSIYEIRRALGEPALLTRGDEVVLNLDRAEVDVIAFLQATDRADWESAAACYTGPFLDGFFVADAPEFERWAEAEREHLAQKFRAVLERLAERRSGCGELRGAVEAWRRLAVEDPLNSRVVIGLMTALEAAGDRAGAIQHARVHAALLREELGTGADAGVEAMAERLRRDPGVLPVVPPRAAETSTAHEEAGTEPGGAAHAVRASSAEPLQPQGAVPSRYLVRSRFWLLGAVSLLLLLLTFGTGTTRTVWQRQQPDGGVSMNRVAVLPFRMHGAAEYVYLETGLVDLLSMNLDGAGELRSVDPHALHAFIADRRLMVTDHRHARVVARRFGAGLYVMGTVSEVAGRLRIMAGLYEVGRDHQPAVQTMVEGPAEELFSIVDMLSSRLLVERLAAPGSRLERSAVAATSSLPALKAYLEGEQFFRSGQFGPAIEALQRAVAEDSTFALAYYRLSVAAEWGARRDLMRPAAETALRLADRLPARDRQLLEALLAWQQGKAADAEQRYGAILDVYPDDVEARFQLAEVRFHYNPFRGRAATESRGAWERLLELAPDNRFAVVHLARLDAFEGAHASLDRRWQRIRELDAEDDPRVIEVAALRALAIGDSAAERRVMERIRRLDGEELMQMVSYLAGFSQNLAGVRGFATVMTEPARSPATRLVGHLERGYLDVAMGHWRRARRELDAAATIDPTSAGLHLALLAGLPDAPFATHEAAELRARIERLGDVAPQGFLGTNTGTPPLYPVAREYLLGLLSIRLDDPGTAQHHAARLDSMTAPPWVAASARDMAHGLRARIAMHGGDAEGALRELEQIRMEETPYNVARNSPFRGRGAERLLRAEVLSRLGHDEEALRWYASLGATSYLETIHLAPAHLRRAQIHERRGELGQAREHYRRFVELWKDADSELQPEVRRARAALARLRTAGP